MSAAELVSQDLHNLVSGNYGEGDYRYFLELAREEFADPSLTSPYWSREETRRFSLADRLRGAVEEIAAEVENPFLRDLIGSALAFADWSDLADTLLEGMEDDEDDEDVT
jgi:hypothetical protein